jgi:hypothetical protein
MDRLLMQINAKSEQLFFEMLSQNSNIALRDICRKIARVQVYRIIQKIESVQRNAGFDIIERKFDTSAITSLPVVNLQVNKQIEVKEFDNEKWVVIGG